MSNAGSALMQAVIFVGVICVSPGVSAAGQYERDISPSPDFNPSLAEQWKEADVPVPAYPRDADLVAVPLAPGDKFGLFVDTKSVGRAADRVLRLTLVVESSSGTRNVFFDGIRCETREYKTYAIGSPDKRFVMVKNAGWQELQRLPYNAFRRHLSQHYACDNMSSAFEPKEFLRRLQFGPDQ